MAATNASATRKNRQPPTAIIASGVQPLPQLPGEDLDGGPRPSGHLFLPDRFGLEAAIADRFGPGAQRGVELARRPDVSAAAADHGDHVGHRPNEGAQRRRALDRVLAARERGRKRLRGGLEVVEEKAARVLAEL